MMLSIRSRLLGCALCAAVMYPSGTWAEPNPRPAHGQSGDSGTFKKKRAHELFRRGQKLQDQGKHLEAAEMYKKANQEYFIPVMVFNIAQALRLGGDTKAALEHYEEYLRLEPEGSGAVDAKAFAWELRRRLTHENEADTQIHDNDSSKVAEPPPMGFLRRNRSAARKRTTGLILGACGMGALAGAGYWAWDARQAEDSLNGYSGTWGAKQEALERRGADNARYAQISVGVGAVLVLAGAGLYIWGNAESHSIRPSVTVTPSESAFVLSGHF